jgi:stress response protein YsnF
MMERRDDFTQSGFIIFHYHPGIILLPPGTMSETKGQDEHATIDRSNTANIPIVEETIQIKRELIEKGSTRFTKKVDGETVEIPLTSRTQQYSIERIPVNRYVEVAPPGIRHEGKTMIISIIEEEAVIQKRLKIVEELHITLTEVETRTKTEVNLRKERIIIEKDPETSNKQ